MAKLPSVWWALFHPQLMIALLDDMTQTRDLMRHRFEEAKQAAERLLKSDEAHRQKLADLQKIYEQSLEAWVDCLVAREEFRQRIASVLMFIQTERNSPTRMTANRITLFNNKDVRTIEQILAPPSQPAKATMAPAEEEEYDPFAE